MGSDSAKFFTNKIGTEIMSESEVFMLGFLM